MLPAPQQSRCSGVKPALAFPWLRDFPDGWGKFPSWGSFLHREAWQTPEQGGGAGVQSYARKLTARGRTEAGRIYPSVEESCPDILPPLSLSPSSQTSASPAPAAQSFPLTPALVIFRSAAELIQVPNTAESHSCCCQENVVLAQQVESAWHNIRWAPGGGEARPRKGPCDRTDLKLHSNSCYCSLNLGLRIDHCPLIERSLGMGVCSSWCVSLRSCTIEQWPLSALW